MKERKKIKYITYEDRLFIKRMCEENVPVKQMADILGVNIVTLNKELKRGGVEFVKYQRELSQEQRKKYDPEYSQRNLRSK